MKKPSSAVVGTGYIKDADTLGLYSTLVTLEGTTYLFDTYFMHLVRYALSTFCISEMNVEQVNLFTTYIAAVNKEVAHTDITLALDKELVDITICREDAGVIVCGNAALHIYDTCGTDINL